MVVFDPCKYSQLKFDEFSVKVSAFFLKKINQYKVFEKVAEYRRFWAQ